MHKQIVVYPGQRIVAKDGKTYTVALIIHNKVYVYDTNGWLKAVQVVGDAWGGEHDQTVGLVA
jgi:hypothetical protein